MNIKDLINNDVTQDELLNYNNATLLFKKLPIEINGLIVRKNDINIIIINDNLGEEARKKAFLHELSHLELNHTYKYNVIDNNVEKYEHEVDLYLNKFNFD